MYKIKIVNTDTNKSWENTFETEMECMKWAIEQSKNPDKNIHDKWVGEMELSNEQIKEAVDARFVEVERFIYIKEYKFTAVACYKIEEI